MPADEQRHFTRVPFDATASLTRLADGRRWDSALLDICLQGALVRRPPGWQGARGERYRLTVRLGEDGPAIAMEGELAHVESDCMGFGWAHLDVDSATHLHRLMELNLGDARLLERELAELLALRER